MQLSSYISIKDGTQEILTSIRHAIDVAQIVELLCEEIGDEENKIIFKETESTLNDLTKRLKTILAEEQKNGQV